MKNLFLTVLCLSLSVYLLGQASRTYDKITLNTGAVYIGEIVLRTDEIVMIKTTDGKKYQFPVKEIKLTEKISNTVTSETTSDAQKTAPKEERNLSGDIEWSGGVSGALNSFQNAPFTQVLLVFGNKNASGKNIFFGVGAGYGFTFLATQTAHSLPVFLRIQSPFLKTRTSPFLGFDAGYTFGLSSAIGGGPMVKLSAGVVHKLSYKSDFYAGFVGGLASITTSITEKNEFGTFTYTGPTTMTNLGLKLGFHF